MSEQRRANAPILVLAPLGRDAEVACDLLARAGLACTPGRDLRRLDDQPLDELGALVLAEELPTTAGIRTIGDRLAAQPPWASVAVIIFRDPEGRRCEKARLSLDEIERHSSVILLERPTGAASFVSVLRAAVLTREKQYQLRDELAAREQAEARARNIAEEMKHRVKNSLTVAGSIAAQTFQNAETLDEALKAYSARLAAMARAQDLLTVEGHDNADLHELIDQALRPYRPGEDWSPFEVDGPEVRIGARAATALSMAMHELATNAVKYGALSVGAGRVGLRWRTVESPGARTLRLEWSEHGGPAVTAPQRRGFGSRLIERALAYDLGGKAAIAFEPQGIVCTISAKIGPSADPP